MAIQQETVQREEKTHPLDALTRNLIRSLETVSSTIVAIDSCLEGMWQDDELRMLLTGMRESLSQWLQHLEPEVRQHLRPYGPASPREPW